MLCTYVRAEESEKKTENQDGEISTRLHYNLEKTTVHVAFQEVYDSEELARGALLQTLSLIAFWPDHIALTARVSFATAQLDWIFPGDVDWKLPCKAKYKITRCDGVD